MAEAEISVVLDQFICSICLDLLNDPVTLLCGHSFCMVCINVCWDQEDQNGYCSCPQCRQTFTPRPVVSRNIALAEVVDNLKKTRLQAAPPAQCPAGPDDVLCDSCTKRKQKAIRSCLVCLASFCKTHLQAHYKSPALKKHKLVEASRRLQEQICSQHDKLLEVYCRTDQKCICMLCMLDEHKGHDTASAAAARAEKQKQLLEIQEKSKQRIQEREMELQELIKAVGAHKHSAQTAVQTIDSIFTELIKSIERRRSELKDLISTQEEAAVSQAAEVMKQLEQEIEELKRKDTEIEGVLHSEDSIHVLQSFKVLVTPSGTTDLPTTLVNSSIFFEDAVRTVSQVQNSLEACFKEQFIKVSSEVRKVLILPPQSREEYLLYSCQLTLDPNTANERVQLSDSNRMATDKDIQPQYNTYTMGCDMYGRPKRQRDETYEHPKSFKYHSQVLCSESVSEPSYWEVELSGNNGGSIAVSYDNISRKRNGNDCIFGYNNKSWSLQCSSSSCSFLHNNQQTNISLNTSYFKIGVFLDPKAGNLSFYSVSDTMKLLHRVQTKFTQPLYPGFGLNRYSNVKLL